MLRFRIRQNIKIFETLDDFIQDMSQAVSPNVKLENVEVLFFTFGGILMTVLFVFVVNVFLLKQLQAIIRKLVPWSASLKAIAQRTLSCRKIYKLLFKFKFKRVTVFKRIFRRRCRKVSREKFQSAE